MSLFNDIAIDRFVTRAATRYLETDGKIVLDVGCGKSPYKGRFESPSTRRIGIDVRRQLGVDGVADALHLPFRSGSVDIVLMSEVIEHLRNPAVGFAEAMRVLRPGGILILTWPFNYMMHEVPRDFSRLTEFGVSALAESHGAAIEELYRTGNAIVVVLAIVEFLSTGALEALSRVVLLGLIFRPIHWLLSTAIVLMYHVILWGAPGRIYHSAGDGLHGIAGHLRLWCLGYCASIRASRGDSHHG